MRWDRVMEGPAAVPGDQALIWYFLVPGAGLNPRLVGCEDSVLSAFR
jgi:hypothetical protein